MFNNGASTKGFEEDPASQVYVKAPLAVSVAEEPAHSEEELDEIEMTGTALTTTIVVCVSKHTL